jgi:predicted phosphohydrolase
MNVQYASDLHLDQLTSYISSQMIIPKANVLILGGDICHIESISNHTHFFQYISKSFQYTLYIPGNHEFYSGSYSIDELEEMVKEFLDLYPNIIYLNNSSVFIEDVLFTGSCLWCNPSNDPPPWFLIDISSNEIKNMHNKSIRYLERVSSLRHPKQVMITHYPPIPIDSKKRYRAGTVRKYDDYYQNSAVYLSFLPSIWIFGHIHENVYIKHDNTLFLSNQRKDKKYNPGLTFHI